MTLLHLVFHPKPSPQLWGRYSYQWKADNDKMSSEEISTFQTSNLRGDNGGDHSTNGLNPVDNWLFNSTQSRTHYICDQILILNII